MAGHYLEPRQVKPGATARWIRQAAGLLINHLRFAPIVVGLVAFDHRVSAWLAGLGFSLAAVSPPFIWFGVLLYPIVLLLVRASDAVERSCQISMARALATLAIISGPVLLVDSAISWAHVYLESPELITAGDISRHGLIALFAVYGFFGIGWLPLVMFHGIPNWAAYRLGTRAMALNGGPLVLLEIGLPSVLISLSFITHLAWVAALGYVLMIACGYVAYLDIFERRGLQFEQRATEKASVAVHA